MTAAVEDGTVTCDLIAEAQLLRNVIGALRRALDDHPEGCLEAVLWHGVEACFVPRVIFNEAVDILICTGLALRAGGRLHAGLNRTDAARADRRSSLFRALSHRLGAGRRAAFGWSERRFDQVGRAAFAPTTAVNATSVSIQRPATWDASTFAQTRRG